MCLFSASHFLKHKVSNRAIELWTASEIWGPRWRYDFETNYYLWFFLISSMLDTKVCSTSSCRSTHWMVTSATTPRPPRPQRARWNNSGSSSSETSIVPFAGVTSFMLMICSSMGGRHAPVPWAPTCPKISQVQQWFNQLTNGKKLGAISSGWQKPSSIMNARFSVLNSKLAASTKIGSMWIIMLLELGAN